MKQDNVSRRSVLKGAATLALPYLIPESVWGTSARKPPSERIVLGFIGLGDQGTNQLIGTMWAPEGGFIGRSDTQVVAVCDVNRRRLETARQRVNEKYGNSDCTAYHKYEEMLAREDIDAVVIATGDRWHAPLSVAAARAGKDVYCEKPHTLTIRETQIVAETMKRYNRIMQVGTQQRSWQEFRYTCELVQNGYIGEVKSVKVNVDGSPRWYSNAPAEPEPDWLDWDRWLGQSPWRPYSSQIARRVVRGRDGSLEGWQFYRDYSGGGMTDWGAHMFDITQWALGMDESGPVEIIPPNGKDVKVLTYRYANGALVQRNKINQPAPGILIEGTEGTIEVTREYFETNPAHLKHQIIGPNEIHLHKSFNHQGDFLNSVRTRKRNVCDAEIGRRSITVCHLGNIAYWLERPLRWDPIKEEFIGDMAANVMLDREKRHPWTM